jgi:hypothetical protein
LSKTRVVDLGLGTAFSPPLQETKRLNNTTATASNSFFMANTLSILPFTA